MDVSLDILTDGSEYTGGPALFLTLRKSATNVPDTIPPEGAILARYNLTGLPSLTGRLASDQSFQLLSSGCFRCLLLPSLDNIGGLAALFLSLVQYGYKVLHPTITSQAYSDSEESVEDSSVVTMPYSDVTIIGPQHTSTLIDGILDTLFGNTRKRPSIRVCEVPSDKHNTWWNVYQDSYIRIWATSVENIYDGCSANKKRKRAVSSCNNDPMVVYIVVIKPHKQRYGSNGNMSDSTLFAILPHNKSNSASKCKIFEGANKNNNLIWDVLRNLPEEIIETRNSEQTHNQHHLDFIIHLNPFSNGEITTVNNLDQVPIHVPTWAIESKLSQYHLSTFPDKHRDALDPGLLIRAQQRHLLLNKYLPFIFPLNHSGADMVGTIEYVLEDKREEMESSVDCIRLQSCSSVVINKNHSFQDKESLHELPLYFNSRIEIIRSRCSVYGTSMNYSDTKTNLDAEALETLKRTFRIKFEDNYHNTAAEDVNEIDLDVSSVSDEDVHKTEHRSVESLRLANNYLDVSSPHLLLLGTGCATPSPSRGSSSYALLMPTTIQSKKGNARSVFQNELVLTAILECGEGTLTSLSRHLHVSNAVGSLSLDEQLGWVQFIWISHSHLDHYGDIPSIVRAIVASKCTHGMSTRPLLVIAPSKVLKFLRVMLGFPNDNSRSRDYVAVTHREFKSSPFASNVRSMLHEYALRIPSFGKLEQAYTSLPMYNPFASLRNIEVDHCPEAFALILELRIPQKDSIPHSFVLCFSGDTRPSDNLVKACRSSCPLQSNLISSQHYAIPPPPPPPPHVSLLIHEATFMNDDHGKVNAVKKRHCTAAEALRVAERMQVDACLLTHFSQRYTHVSIRDATTEYNNLNPSPSSDTATGCYPFAWGIGIDGMTIQLTKEAIGALQETSMCIDDLLS